MIRIRNSQLWSGICNTCLWGVTFLLSACGGGGGSGSSSPPPPNQPPTAAFTLEPDSGDAPLAVKLDAGSSKDSDGTITSYVWQLDGMSESGLTLEHTFEEPGTYTITLTVTDNDGASTKTEKQLTVEPVNQPPVPKFSISPSTGKAPLTTTLDATASSDSDGLITNYAWLVAGMAGSGPTLERKFNEPGTYTITLTVTDNDGASATEEKQVTVEPVNQPPIPEFSMLPATGAAPLTVSFDATASSDSDGTILSYGWQIGNHTNSGVTTQHTFTEPGNYETILTVTDDDGAYATKTAQLEVTEPAFTVTGAVKISNAIIVDSDVNDPRQVPVPNNSFSEAQLATGSVVIGGFVNNRQSGAPDGALFDTGDPWDFYEFELQGGETITLSISETNSDLDLYLWDAQHSLVDASLGYSSVESLHVGMAGTYYVEVWPESGASNYVLFVGQDDLQITGYPPLRLSTPFIPGQLIVMPKNPNVSITANTPNRTAEPVLYHIPEYYPLEKTGATHGTVSAEQRKKIRTLHALKAKTKDPKVAYAEPNMRIQPFLQPDDPDLPLQWHYENISLPSAWDTSTGSQEVIVAVVDSGVLTGHPDLTNKLIHGYDFITDLYRARDGDGIDDNPDDPGDLRFVTHSSFHGTHVAGTVAAQTNNQLGVAGVSWNTSIMPLRALGRDGGDTFDVLQAVRYAAGLSNSSGQTPDQPADIINMSFGNGVPSRFMENAIFQAQTAGIFLVAAAGNDGTSEPKYPAAYPGVISVSATTISDTPAPYTSFGLYIDVAAPGGDLDADQNVDGEPDGVYSTDGDDMDRSGPILFTYGAKEGTSMAAPHVSGIIALMKSVYPKLTPAQFDNLLKNGEITDDLGDVGRDDYHGYGLINAQKAVSAAATLAANPPPDPGPRLALSPPSLNFGNYLNRYQVTVANTGTGSLNVNEVNVSKTWVSVQAPSSSDGLGDYVIQIDRSVLPEGINQATVTFSSDANTVQLEISAENQRVNFPSDVGKLYLVLIDREGNHLNFTTAEDVNRGVYQYSINEVPPGEYQIFATTDTDGDGEVCDTGEACGAYPSLINPAFVEIEKDTEELNFTTTFQLEFDNRAR